MVRKKLVLSLMCIIIGIIIYVSISKFKNGNRVTPVSVSLNPTVTEEVPEVSPEIHLETYEDLVRENKSVTSHSEKKGDGEIDLSSEGDEEKTVRSSEVVIIDESEKTMDDQTIGENEYDVSKEHQGKIKLHKGKEVEKDTKGSTKATGEKNVGTWN